MCEIFERLVEKFNILVRILFNKVVYEQNRVYNINVFSNGVVRP